MPEELTFASAFLVGLLGSVHCIGMCGGIATVLGVRPGDSRTVAIMYSLAYNFARIFSYTTAGLLMGAVGGAVGKLVPPGWGHPLAAGLSGLFLVALALYIGGWWSALARLEALGGALWRQLQPWLHQWLPARGVHHALLLGLVWGWLPCGLVYTTLVWSLSSGSAATGALLMFGFGLGTIPAMVAVGGMGQQLAGLRSRPRVRQVIALFLLAVGLSTVWSAYQHANSPVGHDHHARTSLSCVGLQATRADRGCRA